MCLSLLSFGFPAAEQGVGSVCRAVQGGKCTTGSGGGENALVSGACVGLGASVLTWDCATHLPNGFILREDEDTLPHVAPISLSEWSSLASPGTLTTPGLCTQPVPILTIVPQALPFFSLPWTPY